MLPFRTEIRNSPKEQTLKIYLSDISLDIELQGLLEEIEGVRMAEVQTSMSRNRGPENLTVFREDRISINDLKDKIDSFLNCFFDQVDV
jgi:type III secretory pathway lipoprotein EscJ